MRYATDISQMVCNDCGCDMVLVMVQREPATQTLLEQAWVCPGKVNGRTGPRLCKQHCYKAKWHTDPIWHPALSLDMSGNHTCHAAIYGALQILNRNDPHVR